MPHNDNTRSFNADAKPVSEATRSHDAIPSTQAYSGTGHQLNAVPDIPGYTELEEIAQGGMGVVYKATQLKLNRPVAIKMVLGHHANQTKTLIRFLAEAEAVATIDHPNVIRIYESGSVGGTPYIAMEYLPGGTLSEKLKQGVMPTKEAVELICKIALGVQAAHNQQIVHRDLKPANVLFDANHEPKVMDFGLAKKTGGSDLTATNAIMGTPAYMAPEQAKGESKFVGPAADIWALGVMLFECLTGQRPFKGFNEIEILRKLVDEEPSSLRSVNAAIPRELELVALKCLKKDPAERYGSAKELVEDLERWQAGRPVSVQEASRTERITKWVKRNKAASAVLAASVLVAISMAGLAVWAFGERNRADIAARDANDNKTKAEDNEKNTREEKRKATQLLDVMRIREANTAFDNNLVEYARETLEDVAEENRTIAWHFTKRACEGSDWTIWGHTKDVTCVALSPDGGTLASGSYDNTIRLWDTTSGQTRKELNGHTRSVTSVSWSPDGRTLASGSNDGTIRLWDTTTGQTRKELQGHSSFVTSVSWSPDGRTVASGSGDETIRLWDTTTGQIVKELKGHSDNVNCVSWSPDGRTLASGSGDTTIRLWDTTTGQTRKELKGHTSWVYSVSWSPDGRTLASGGDFTIRLWDTTTGQTLKELKGHTDRVTSVSWSPDGLTLASGSADNTIRLWDTTTGQTLKERKGHTALVFSVSWSPDGLTLASGSGDKTIRLWDTTTGQTLKELKGHSYYVLSVSWSPDGRTLASGSADTTIRLWNTTTAQTRKELQGHFSFVTSVSWSPDGRTLASGSWDKTICLWDATTGQTRKVLKGHSYNVNCLSWSPDGRTLASGSLDETIRLWDTSTGQTVKELKGHNNQVLSVSWSPDGRTLATGSENTTIRLWDTTTGQSLKELKGHTDKVTSVSWSPDGLTLASGSADNTIRFWNTTAGQNTKELKGHTDTVTSMSWSPDGRTLASGSYDKTTRLWDTTTGQMVKVLRGHTQEVSSVSWSADGRTLASGSNDATIRLWDAKTGEQLKSVSTEEIERRRQILAPKPDHHRQKAKECEKSEQWFAAAFHTRRLLLSEPENADAKKKLAEYESQLKQQK